MLMLFEEWFLAMRMCAVVFLIALGVTSIPPGQALYNLLKLLLRQRRTR